MALSPASLLARLEELKKWQQVHQEKLMKQHTRRLEEVDNISSINRSLSFNENTDLLFKEKSIDINKQLTANGTKSREDVISGREDFPIEKVNVNKPKRPYLKRGTGLIRYKMTLGEQHKAFHVNNKPKMVTDKLLQNKSVPIKLDGGHKQITPLKRPEASIQPNTLWTSVAQSKMITSETEVNQNIISQINELANLDNKPTESRVNCETTSQSSYKDTSNESESDITSAGDQTLYERANENELRIFETLEERALDSSFCSTNSSIIRLLESTPQKSHNKSTGKPGKEVRRSLNLYNQDYGVVTKDQYETIRRDHNLDIRKLVEENIHKLPLENIIEESGKTTRSNSSCSQFNDEETWSDTTSSPSSDCEEESVILLKATNADVGIQTDIKVTCDCEETFRAKLTILNKEIDSFRHENSKIKSIEEQLQEEERKLNKERKNMEKELQEERIKMDYKLEEDRKKLAKEKMVFERYVKDQQNKPSKKERQETTSLKLEIENLKETLKLKETRNATTQARLRNQVKSLEKDNANLKEELDKLTKQNAKLQVNQRVNSRRPSDTKMLHEINKNLTKLTTTNVEKLAKNGNRAKKKVQTVENESSTSSTTECISDDEDDESDDSLIEDDNSTKKNDKRKLCKKRIIEKRNACKNTFHEPVRETPEENRNQKKNPLSSNPSTFNKELTPPLTLRQKRNVENCENDRNVTNIEALNEIKSYSDTSIERNYEKFFAESNLKPSRLSNNSLNDSQKNGKVERVLADGSTEITYPNGNVKLLTPDGNIITVKYYNGDIKETRLLDGTIRYYYKENETWHTTYPDGMELLEFVDGQTEKRFPDGSIEVQFQSGVIRQLEKDGTEKVTYPDGTVVKTDKDGNKIMLLPNGQKEIHTKEHKRREYPDGTIKILYPDGLQETRYSNGRIRLKDKTGRLLMDTHDNLDNTNL